jgi:hypothetical protein
MLYCYICVALLKAEFNLPRRVWLKSVTVQSLYSTGYDSYMRTQGLTGGLGVVDALLQQVGLYS